VILREKNSLKRTVKNWLYFWGGFTRLSKEIILEFWRPPYYPRLILEQMQALGVNSLSLVLVTGIATGSVLALQFGLGLARFGGKLYIPKVVILSIFREMGPVFTSLLVAGRVGSGITAEIASMNINQQIDAIRCLGTNPIKKIVIPRVIAFLIVLPCLTIRMDTIACIGAMLVSVTELNIPIKFFYAKIFEVLHHTDILTGIVKSIIFSLFISITACWKGLNTTGGTQGVGIATTWVVVTSCIFIMISDFFITKIFFYAIYPQ
jgi:phospholipid/cholesterol/gamma-HCH transport system permease protein